ncbi:putative malate dehydrogenase protein [Oceanicola granulosus HTCC2516]|uniref:Putative malate dehydrogenase protein n=1 Tax=Oceanicola granulosus (strain ATCC BAA-861 / DSM 15982 / KCTC 12143 / HTCC2516) TaxID=314256 RepID=Q2CGC2_OCEGH|nr:Ldh family oxidoreductase [Oceanicola granulosus]EAR51796.1 putative malate dehydrogenase protein [Oceanicola granulosus HTCC2516]
MTETRTSFAALAEDVGAIFERAGLVASQARALGRVIAAGERDACKSHGIYRIEGCLKTIAAGKVAAGAEPEVTGEDGAVVRVSAHGGFSVAAFEMGVPRLEARARAHGVAALVINDCVHFSALWPEIEALTERDLAALAMCPSYASVAPAGGAAPLLGTNPMAFGWPRAEAPPYVFDFATSVAARGEIELHRKAGKALPDGWAIDADGAPTTDPEAALAGAMLPFGAHKGSAISTMIELLAGVMIGDLTSPEALEAVGTTALAPRHGELILAFDPARLAGGRGDPLARAEVLFEAIQGQGARLPSQRRFRARAAAERDGIALGEEDVAMLARFRRDGLAALEG